MVNASDVRTFDPQTASETEFSALNRFLNILRAESWPEDPPRSRAHTVKSMHAIALYKDIEVKVWTARQEGEIVAHCLVVVAHREDNRHLLQLALGVLPTFRRQGIATRLLHHAEGIARAENRRLLLSDTHSNAPAGEAFARRLGAKPGLEMHTNQLDLTSLDRNLLHAWREAAAVTARGFALGFWEGSYPEEVIAEVATMRGVMNTAPQDNLEVEDFTFTPERLRQEEAYLAARNLERWTVCARHTPSGELAGYTEVTWDPENPEALQQGDTGVLPRFRGHGLGKALKAVMLERVMAERPHVKRVRTGNADSNAPMLKLNRALGFEPYRSQTLWQLERETLSAFLHTRPRVAW